MAKKREELGGQEDKMEEESGRKWKEKTDGQDRLTKLQEEILS